MIYQSLKRMEVLITAIAFAATCAVASTYYVDPSGADDNTADGSSSKPYRTLKYAVPKVAQNQGHTIHLNAGTFTEAGQIDLGPGVSMEGAGQTSTTIRNSSASGPVIALNGTLTNGNQSIRNLRFDGQDRSRNNALHVQNRHNVVVDHCTFDNFSDIILRLSGAGWGGGRTNRVHGCELANLTFNNCGVNTTGGFKAGVIVVGTSDSTRIHDVTINSPALGTHGIKYDWGAAGDDREGGWNFGLKVYNCTIMLGGDGFSIELFNSYNGTEVCNCTLNRMVSMGGNKDSTLNGDGVIDMRLHHCTIEGNVLECQTSDVEVDHNYNWNAGDWGIAIWNAGDHGVRRNYYIHDNVFEGSADQNSEALRLESTSGPKNFWFYNNTCSFLSRGVFFHTRGTTEEIDGVTIRNNIFHRIRRGGVEIYRQDAGTFRNVTITHNIAYQGAGAVWYGDTGLVQNKTVNNNWSQDPGLALGGAKPDRCYLPASPASFCVNRGSATGLPDRASNRTVAGSAIDIGAYEFGGSTGMPTPAPRALSRDRSARVFSSPNGSIVAVLADVNADRDLRCELFDASGCRLADLEKGRAADGAVTWAAGHRPERAVLYRLRSGERIVGEGILEVIR